jgi:serine/threonine-protein kinase Chk2
LGGADVPAYFHSPGLALRFSSAPKTQNGFVFGCDDDCDIVLPQLSSISVRHFALTFDEQYRPIVKDLQTSNGTEVRYDGQGQGRRRGFAWIVGGAHVPEDYETIIINVNDVLKLQVVVPCHDTTSQLYIDNVSRFWQGTVGADSLLGLLDLRTRPPTEPGSGAQTPGTGPIFLKKVVGEGAFGVVRHFWNVSTAEEFAVKQPSAKAIRERRVDIAEWERESYIMGQISHVG